MNPYEDPADAGEAPALAAGTWSFDLRRLDLHWSAEAAAIHGHPGLHRPGLGRALESMDPLDRAQLIATVLASVRRDGVFEADVRITTPQRTRKLVRVFGHVETDAAGVPLALHGLLEDLNHGASAARERELRLAAQAMAHPLKAHAGAMHAAALALERTAGDALPADGRQELGRLRQAAAQTERIVDAIGRLGSGAPLQRERVDVSAVALRLLEALREREPGRDVEISVQPGLEVMADAQLVTLLLDQLLSNAWKFTATRERARITVDAVSSGGDRVLRVADNGVGFHPHDAGRIFRLFTRLEGAEAFDGSGVGLALAWRIVERHGGLIWAHGDPGQGATFFVRL